MADSNCIRSSCRSPKSSPLMRSVSSRCSLPALIVSTSYRVALMRGARRLSTKVVLPGFPLKLITATFIFCGSYVVAWQGAHIAPSQQLGFGGRASLDFLNSPALWVYGEDLARDLVLVDWCAYLAQLDAGRSDDDEKC